MKSYLQQVYRINTRINSKIEQIKSLRELAERITVEIERTPKGNGDGMAGAVDSIVDLQREVCDEVAKLVDVKREIAQVINEVDNIEQRTVLELRYLSCLRWEEIAVIMGYTMQRVFQIHKAAINSINGERVELI